MCCLLSLLTFSLMAAELPGETPQDYGRRDTDFRCSLLSRSEYPPGYDIEIETTKRYPCTGYIVRAGVTRNADTVTVSIGGLLRPSPCVPLPSEATGSLYLGNIGEGEYVLRIRYRSEEELHRLIITPAGGFVRSSPGAFTRFRQDQLPE